MLHIDLGIVALLASLGYGDVGEIASAPDDEPLGAGEKTEVPRHPLGIVARLLGNEVDGWAVGSALCM